MAGSKDYAAEWCEDHRGDVAGGRLNAQSPRHNVRVQNAPFTTSRDDIGLLLHPLVFPPPIGPTAMPIVEARDFGAGVDSSLRRSTASGLLRGRGRCGVLPLKSPEKCNDAGGAARPDSIVEQLLPDTSGQRIDCQQ